MMYRDDRHNDWSNDPYHHRFDTLPPRQKQWLVGLVFLALIGICMMGIAASYPPKGPPWRGHLEATPLSKMVTGKSYPLPTPVADAKTLNSEGLQALANGDSTQAATLFLAAITADAQYYEPYNNLAFIRYEQGQDASAIQLWQMALQRNSTSADANAGLAIARFAQGAHEEAYEHYAHALARYSGYNDLEWMRNSRCWGPRALAGAAALLASMQ